MQTPAPDPAFHWTIEPWGQALRCRALDQATQHLFTSKQLALPGDEGWQRALASVRSSPERLMRVKQVHGNSVRVVTASNVNARDRPDGDAIVSNVAGLALAVLVADCVPILIADARTGAAAAIHAGWRGTCARVTAAAIEAMQREWGSQPSDLIAAIGPSAGPDDYEVGDALIDAFRDAGHDRASIDAWFIRSSVKPHLDLWAANRDQLIASGLRREHIHICGLSTVSHPDVFASYRVNAEHAGRMAGIIIVPAAT